MLRVERGTEIRIVSLHGSRRSGNKENINPPAGCAVLPCSMLYCVLELCTVISTLRWAVLTVLWIGFCHTGPISLCVDSFVFICEYLCTLCLFFSYCMLWQIETDQGTHCCWTASLEQPTSPPTWLWTYSPGVSSVTEDAPVLLRTAAPTVTVGFRVPYKFAFALNLHVNNVKKLTNNRGRSSEKLMGFKILSSWW